MNTDTITSNARPAKAVLDYSRPLVMGIVNVTPDSFSDGGKFIAADIAISHALSLIDAGADIIDIGGESSRPGAESVTVEEELQRIIPVVAGVRAKSEVTISIDTTKSAVARESINSGADIINDISAGLFDSQMIPLVASSDAGYIIMHMLGTPQTMQSNLEYQDVVTEVRDFLRDRYDYCLSAGIKPNRLLIDPGIGFGKTAAHNLALLKNLKTIAKLGAPMLIGVSRKAFIPSVAGGYGGSDESGSPSQRLGGSLAAALFAVEQGASVVRVHDVHETVQALRVIYSLQKTALTGKESTR